MIRDSDHIIVSKNALVKLGMEPEKIQGNVPERAITIHPKATTIYPSLLFISFECFFVSNIDNKPKNETIAPDKIKLNVIPSLYKKLKIEDRNIKLPLKSRRMPKK